MTWGTYLWILVAFFLLFVHNKSYCSYIKKKINQQEILQLEWALELMEFLVYADNKGWSEVKVIQSCLTLWLPWIVACQAPLSQEFQARTLEWVAVPFSRGSSQPRDWTQVSLIAGGFFTNWATREAQEYWSG